MACVSKEGEFSNGRRKRRRIVNIQEQRKN